MTSNEPTPHATRRGFLSGVAGGLGAAAFASLGGGAPLALGRTRGEQDAAAVAVEGLQKCRAVVAQAGL